MNTLLAPEARILTSAAFRRARRDAASLIASRDALEALLDEVDAKCVRHPELRAGALGMHLDVMRSVVRAHLDGFGRLESVGAACRPRTITGSARLRLVVAALRYLIDADDVIPDSRPDGMTDDAVLLRWASRMVRAELSAAS